MDFLSMEMGSFNFFLLLLTIIALVVFVCLFFVNAGYGKMRSAQWGPSINNRVAWVLMEAPVFFVMLYLWANSNRPFDTVPLIMFLFFELHYFQRSFIFPFIMRGKGSMPLIIMFLGVVFNIVNGYIQARWLFDLSYSKCMGPEGLYPISWLTSWQFILGTIMFFAGMIINIHSDSVIRHLRKPGDNKHYLPKKGLYKYVTSANYFGEIIEWAGWAILTWSYAGAVFLWWTVANLVPRANAIYKQYQKEFPDEFNAKKLKRVFPFIY